MKTAAFLILLITTAVLAGLLWPESPPGEMQHPRSEIHAASIGDDIYIAGGIGRFRTLASCERFNAVTRSWHRCPDLPRALHHVGMAADGKTVYASGGYKRLPFKIDDDPALLALKPTDTAWRRIGSLPHPLGQHGMIYQAGGLYLVGGHDGQQALATLWRFDLAQRRWNRMADMPTARHSHAIAVSGSTLYVTGGRSEALGDASTVVEAYDFTQDRWRRLADMPTPRGGHGAYASEGQLHVTGGEKISQGQVLSSTEVLALDGSSWRPSLPLRAPRHGFAIAEAAGRHWVLGGGDAPGWRTIYAVTGTALPVP